ncbi:Sodium-coupled monocarboxylate transporter 1 [Holothuria leucospilota]|uniref:Sodium-coupled monocarboxylate transporter 1 n=1 Tax=Holothuria leucospilota TaxID=206669 RepID=A0A9Q0YHY1_HOLLE|nr:Sodium-coupled monocarboxylate transporter 1 [Holothuria leucospilota]
MADDVGQFGTWDYVILVGMLSVSAFIGIYHAFVGGGQKTADTFLLADRNMNPFPVAVSLVASFISAITVLGTPAEVYVYGTMFWLFAFAYIFSGIVVSRCFIPIFYEYEITSTNEYLERRFSKYVRYVGTFLFFLQMILYLGIVIYAPALALNAVTGLSLWGSVLAIGLVCTFYTTIGGMKAVLWTDVFQVAVMFAGFFAVIIQGSINLGGLTNAWQIAKEGGRIDFWDFRLNPTIRHTFWSVVIGGTFTWSSTYGVNQSQVQRYLSVGTQRRANWALGMAIVGMILVVSTACLAGVVMYAYYSTCDPYTAGYVSQTDQYIKRTRSSTVSSGLNSLAAVTGEDILKAFKPDISEARYAFATKCFACFYGAVCILMTVIASQLGGVLQAALSIFGIVGGPLLGLFSLGIFFPCANSKGAAGGTMIALVMAFWVGIGAQIYPPETNPPPLDTTDCLNYTAPTPGPTEADPPVIAKFYALSYSWYSLFAWLLTIVFGLLISFATGHQDPKDADRTVQRSVGDSFCCCLSRETKDACLCGVPTDVKDDYEIKATPGDELKVVGEDERKEDIFKSKDLNGEVGYVNGTLNLSDEFTSL